MKKSILFLGALFLLALEVTMTAQFSRTRPMKGPEGKGIDEFRQSWQILAPISRRNLTIYPVVSNLRVDTSGYLTLDDGLASGSVRIGERGQMEDAFYRRRGSRPLQPWQERRQDYDGASVNELVLVNNSSRPLILLAGEVVSGGKQNRIIGADLVVPPQSDPLPLEVFCVEHGRWSAGSEVRGSSGGVGGGMGFSMGGVIAHPAIRKEAEVNKSQDGVWNSVAQTVQVTAAPAPTGSYLDALNSPKVKRDLKEAAASIEAEYESELRKEIGGQGAVGVVVAIDGELVWSDIFSSPDLFRQYWPKLLSSYVMEAGEHGSRAKGVPSAREARDFLLEDRGQEVVKAEPGAYRRTEISARDYEIVALESLGKFGDSGLMIHYNKMARN